MTEAPAMVEERPLPQPVHKARYLALLVPVFGLVELGLHFYFARRAPNADEWGAVRPLVASLHKPGDPVVVAPYWAEPMARLAFGDQLMPIREVARPDVSRYNEALEVSILGRRAPELEGWKVAREERQGKFTLRTVQNPTPVQVTFDFTDHIEPSAAAVRVEKPGLPSVDCSFNPNAIVESGGLGGAPVYPAARFVCPGQPGHVFVGVTLIDDEKSHPRRCIWSHPAGGEAELVTRFRDVPLGSKIHGHAGAGWIIERDKGVPPFTIKIVVAGREAGRFIHEPGDFWKGFEVPLAESAGKTADVEFRVSAPGGGTHVCFEADSR
jgi:hypothetical protein